MRTLSESVLLAIRESSGSEEELFKQDVQELMKALQEENEFQDEDDLIDAVRSEINKAVRFSQQDVHFSVSKKYLKNVIYHWEEIGYSGWIAKMAEEAIGKTDTKDDFGEKHKKAAYSSFIDDSFAGNRNREWYFRGVKPGGSHDRFRNDVYVVMKNVIEDGDSIESVKDKVKKEIENKVLGGNDNIMPQTNTRYLQNILDHWDSEFDRPRWVDEMIKSILLPGHKYTGKK